MRRYVPMSSCRSMRLVQTTKGILATNNDLLRSFQMVLINVWKMLFYCSMFSLSKQNRRSQQLLGSNPGSHFRSFVALDKKELFSSKMPALVGEIIQHWFFHPSFIRFQLQRCSTNNSHCLFIAYMARNETWPRRKYGQSQKAAHFLKATLKEVLKFKNL